MARKYKDVTADLKMLEIEFTGRSPVKYRKERSTFASRARGWSNERYQKELQALVKNQQVREQYQRAAQVLDTETARRISHYSQNRFESEIGGIVPPPERKVDRSKIRVDDRADIWSRWARDESYPTEIEKRAHRINRQNGYDKNAHYGWAAMYYHIVKNASMDTVLSYLEASPFDGDLYVELLSTQGLI